MRNQKSIQKFLGTDNKKCLSTGVKRELKDDHMCFLRQGIFLDTKQSFIELYDKIDAGVDLNKEEDDQTV